MIPLFLQGLDDVRCFKPPSMASKVVDRVIVHWKGHLGNKTHVSLKQNCHLNGECWTFFLGFEGHWNRSYFHIHSIFKSVHKLQQVLYHQEGNLHGAKASPWSPFHRPSSHRLRKATSTWLTVTDQSWNQEIRLKRLKIDSSLKVSFFSKKHRNEFFR